MKYKQGKQRVVNDEVFPYPIQCWCDDEYIYAQVLKIPKPEECKLSPWIMNQLKKNHKIADYSDRLVLCVETDSPRKYHTNRRQSYRHPVDSKYGEISHPAKGGQFFHRNFETLRQTNVQKNIVYRFQIKHALNRIADCIDSYDEAFSRIRMTFRFNVRHPKKASSGIPGSNTENLVQIIDWCEPIYERTGIYSNIVKVKYKDIQ